MSAGDNSTVSGKPIIPLVILAARKLIYVFLANRRADVKPDIRLLIAKPSEHTAIVIALITVAWDTEIAYSFNCIRCYLTDCSSN